MARLAIFVDGGYSRSLARQARIWVDYGKLSQQVRSVVASGTEEPLDLLRTYYYDCLPYMGKNPSSEDEDRLDRKRREFRWLENLPRFAVRQGKLNYRGNDSVGKPILEQKGVDLRMGLDFTQLCVKRQITHAALVAGDSDFLPAVELARSEGIQVWLFYGKNSVADDLRTASDERVAIDRDFLQRVKSDVR